MSQAGVLLISAETCRLCGKARSPSDLMYLSVQTGNCPGWGLCRECYEWHTQALMFLAAERPPQGCARCHRSLDQIHREALLRVSRQIDPVQFSTAALEQESRKMWLHALDGVYVLLCRQCTATVEQLHRHRFRGTPYGESKRIR